MTKKNTPARATEITFNESVMRLAAIHNRTVDFRYAKGAGANIESRRLEPSQVALVGEGTTKEHVTFTGFDPDRGALRNYRLDRIQGEVKFA